MARFQFIRRGIAANPRAQSVVSRHTLRALRLQDAEEDEQGPGWFASSWELVRGLEVREASPGDARLHEWLDGMRAGDRQAAAEVTPPDPFSEFGIDGLELV